MNLLEFIEVQKRDTILHRVPPELKIMLIPISALVYIFGLYFACVILLLLIILYVVVRMLKYFMQFVGLFWLVGFSVIVIDYFYGYGVQIIVLRLFYTMLLAQSSILFMATTNADSFEAFLRRVRLPEVLIKSLLITYNLIPSFYTETVRIRNAQYARGFEWSKNPIRRAMQFTTVALPTFFIALIRAEELQKAIRARGG